MSETKENLQEKLQYVKRAYHTLLESRGPYNSDVQQALSEYVSLLTRTNNIQEAVELSQKSYKDSMENGPGPESPVAADAAARLTQVYCIIGKLAEAEHLATQVLKRCYLSLYN